MSSRARTGCSYKYPKTVRPAWASEWEVRDIGIDRARCMKLVEEGVPTSTTAATGTALTTSVGSSSGAPAGGASIQSTLSGYAENWWEDFVGKTVTKDRTDVTWQFDGSCATGGSTNGTWSWFADSGWVLDSNGGSNNTYCSYHLGETYSSFHNTAFCGYTVYSVYSFVRFYGYYNGTWNGARSSYVSSSCLPLYEHYRQGGPA